MRKKEVNWSSGRYKQDKRAWPRSLATTNGIDYSFFSSSYYDASLHLVIWHKNLTAIFCV